MAAIRSLLYRFVTYGLVPILMAGQGLAAGLTRFKLLVNFLDQSGSGGDQIYDNSKDEDLTVFEPMLFMVHQVDEFTQVDAHFVWDTWSAASDTKLDGNTGASGAGIGQQSRVGGNIGFSKDYKRWKWNSRLGVSSEYDYKSLNLGGSLEGLFAEDNFSLKLSPQIYLDQAKDFDLQENQTTDFESRFIAAVNLSGSQLLSERDILEADYSYIFMNGMLNNISNSVKVDSNPYQNSFSRVEEKLPSRRDRHALSTKWVHAYTEELASHISYRYYFDDWGIKAHTLELGPRFSFGENDQFLMLTYRFYHQTQATFYKKSFIHRENHMTSDSDFDGFEAHRFGAYFSQLIGDKTIFNIDFENFEIDFGAYYYHRSNGLDYTILQTSIGMAF